MVPSEWPAGIFIQYDYAPKFLMWINSGIIWLQALTFCLYQDLCVPYSNTNQCNNDSFLPAVSLELSVHEEKEGQKRRTRQGK